MKALLYKEWKLALHPATLLFLCLAAMLMIPNYPYYVTFFYMTLGIFFICLGGRENHDLFYTMSLPVRKRDVVRARILFCVQLELAQVALSIPFAVLRNRMELPGNQAGMDANVALFGLALVMLGIFNLVFFSRYYRKPDAVGRAFLCGSIALMLFVLVAEGATFVVPFVRDRLDTPDPQNLGAKLCVLAGGIVIYALCTGLVCKRSEAAFEKLDL